jgi:hypothetical protein
VGCGLSDERDERGYASDERYRSQCPCRRRHGSRARLLVLTLLSRDSLGVGLPLVCCANVTFSCVVGDDRSCRIVAGGEVVLLVDWLLDCRGGLGLRLAAGGALFEHALKEVVAVCGWRFRRGWRRCWLELYWSFPRGHAFCWCLQVGGQAHPSQDPPTMSHTPITSPDDCTQQAATAVLAAAGSEDDFAGRLVAVLARVASELGSSGVITAGRLGSWEADLVQQLVKGTIGYDEFLSGYRGPLP